ncbi:MAG: hypothetical protein K2X03_12970 [Bryobacteraceae bacterium]|nr:hypothetical protein [Bryobacteraceae bacterium]
MPRPITEAQRAACQRNAQMSTGPRTEEGKSRARLNAVKHGLTAKLPVLPFENEADFIELRDGFLQDFAPRNTYEKFLVTQLATQAWRMLRCQQIEVGLHTLMMKQTLHDLRSRGLNPDKALAETPFTGLAGTLEEKQIHHTFFRYQNEVNRSFERARKAVESTTRRSVSSPAVGQTSGLSKKLQGQTSGLSTVPAPPPSAMHRAPEAPASRPHHPNTASGLAQT